MSQQPSSSDVSLHLDQQAQKFEAVIKILKDSHDASLRTVEGYKTFFEKVYTDYSVHSDRMTLITGASNLSQETIKIYNAPVQNRLKKARSTITTYLKSIDFGPSIDLENISDEDALIQIKGLFDKWYLGEVESLQKKLKEDINELIDRMKD